MQPSGDTARRALVLLLSGLAGFVSLSYEIIWTRVYSFATGSRAHAFAWLLAMFLLGIAVGARWAMRISRRHPPRDREQLRAVAMFLGGAALAGWLVVPAMAWTLSLDVRTPNFVALYFVGPAAMLLGAQFPLLSHYGIAPDDRAGIWLSYLYAANIAGSVLGSVLTGFFLLDHASMAHVVTGLSIVGLAMSLALFAFARPSGRAVAAWAMLVAVATLALLTIGPLAYRNVYAKFFYRGGRGPTAFTQVFENRSGVIAIDAQKREFSGGVYDGTFSTDIVDDKNGIIRPFSLSAWHPEPKRVLMIGLGTGSWAKVVAHHPDLQKMVVVEINPGYVDVLRTHPQTDSLLDNPKVDIVIDDGRRWMNAHDEKFDAVIINASFHWHAMVSSLLSVEFLELVRRHLRKGGVLMLNTTKSDRVVRTVFDVFGEAHEFLYMVVARRDPGLVPDGARLRRTLLRYRIDGEPVIDPSKPADAPKLQKIQRAFGPGSQYVAGPETLRKRVAGLERITDDNMGDEWNLFIEDERR